MPLVATVSIADWAHPSGLEVQDSLKAVFSAKGPYRAQSTLSGTLCFLLIKSM